MFSALMVDVDGVLICGRPADGKPWAFSLEEDLGVSPVDLQREFFNPYWNDIVLGRCALVDHLKTALAKVAPALSCDDFIAYWFENDARLNGDLLAELRQLRAGGVKVYLATNQEHVRAAYLSDTLGLGHDVDGIYYSAALGHRKPDRAFFEQAALLSGFPVEKLLLIDDTPANVTAAQASGWSANLWREGDSLLKILSKF